MNIYDLIRKEAEENGYNNFWENQQERAEYISRSFREVKGSWCEPGIVKIYMDKLQDQIDHK